MSATLKTRTPVRQETNLGPSRTRMTWSIVLALCVGMLFLSTAVKADEESGTGDTFTPDAAYDVWGYFPDQEADSDQNISVLVMSNRGEKEAAKDLEANTKGINFTSLNVNSYDPQPKDFVGYDAVLLFENGHFGNTKDVGQAIYNYQQNGGGAVLSTFVWQDWSNQAKYKGRVGWGALESVSPLISDTKGCEYNADKMGKILDSTHPIMKGVNSLSANSYRGGTQISAVGKALALWTTPNALGKDDPVVAYNEPKTGGKTVAISVFPDYRHYSKGFGGDFYQLFENALKWVAGKTPINKPGVLQFSATSYNVNENTTAVITVTRTGGSNGIVSVDYATADGTAKAGSDYTAAKGTLKWGNGDTVDKTFKVNITDDDEKEDNETVNLSLSKAIVATIGKLGKAVVTIVDDDKTPPTSKCHATYSAEDRKVTIPLLDIPLLDPITGQPTGDTAVFKGKLELIDGVEDFKVIPDSVAFIEMLEEEDECHAAYSYADRTIHIPFVDVPSVMVLPPGVVVPGPVQVFEVTLQQLPLANDVFHLKDYKYLDTIKD